MATKDEILARIGKLMEDEARKAALKAIGEKSADEGPLQSVMRGALEEKVVEERVYCKHCEFFTKDTVHDLVNEAGECRRMPPGKYFLKRGLVIPDSPEVYIGWPVIFDDAWCGEYRRKG